MLEIQFFTLNFTTHSISRKSGKFHRIIYRTDKIMLLLVMATYQLTLSKIVFTIQDSAKTGSVDTSPFMYC